MKTTSLHRQSARLIVTVLAIASFASAGLAADNTLGTKPIVLCEKGRAFPDIAISPDGKTLATASYEGTVRLWNLEMRNELEPLVVYNGEGHKRKTPAVNAVTFSPDGKLLAVAGGDSKVYVVQLANRKTIFELEHKRVQRVEFSHDGQFIASAALSDAIIWVVNSRLPLWTLSGSYRGEGFMSVGFSPNGKTVAVAANPGPLRIYGTADADLQAKIKQDAIWAFDFTPDSKRLVTVKFWSLVVWDFSGKEPRKIAEQNVADRNDVYDVAVSPNGKIVASTGEEAIRLWDMTGGKLDELITLPGQTGRASSVAFTPNGRILVSASDDGSVRFWRLDQIGRLSGYFDPSQK